MKLKIFIIFTSLLISGIVYAQTEINLGPKLEICYDNVSNCHQTEGIEKIETDKNIFFKITLINDGSLGWICFNNLYYSLTYKHRDQKPEKFGTEEDILQCKSLYHADNYCIPPNETFYFYVPFENYNSMKEEERVREWSIESSVSLEKVKCYTNSSFKMNKCTDLSMGYTAYPKYTSAGEGNTIKFESLAELPEIEGVEEPLTKSFPLTWILGVLGLIVGIIFWAARGSNQVLELIDRIKNKNGEKPIKHELDKEKIETKREMYKNLKKLDYYLEKLISGVMNDEPTDFNIEEYRGYAKGLIIKAKELFLESESDFSTEFKNTTNKLIEKIENLHKNYYELARIKKDKQNARIPGCSSLHTSNDRWIELTNEIPTAQKEIKELLDETDKQIKKTVEKI